MQGCSVTYKGRQVAKDGFRVFIYDKDGNQKLVNSYDEFEDLVSTGIWFIDKPEIKEKIKKRK